MTTRWRWWLSIHGPAPRLRGPPGAAAPRPQQTCGTSMYRNAEGLVKDRRHFSDVWSCAEDAAHAAHAAHAGSPSRLDCVKASEQCLKEQACSTKYRTMRQCVAGGKESNFSMVAGFEAKDECRSAMDALKQSPLYNCRCKRGMKKEKNCLRIYWGMYQTLQGNDFLEDSPYEPVNSRLSDIFRLAPILGKDPSVLPVFLK
ncbi:GDNF family receptor alpha-1 [Merluccius polli]|uniref:GDNF family receptor alpha-1 n=1 Tax=Merluccius polli TaxID=89951 RepID=A0AA47NU62_MERPO|nr:GDNF family receptor alpha-1 [Merluccius polli]